MQSLGFVLDVSTGIAPIADLAAGANTGKRIHMRNYDTLGVLFCKGPASAGTDTVTLNVQEHNAASAGTSQALACITRWYHKSTAAALVGTETWTEVAQAASANLVLANTSAVPAANQALVMFEIESGSLSAGFEWLSVSIADPGAGGTIPGGVIYIPTGLKQQMDADRLPNPNA